MTSIVRPTPYNIYVELEERLYNPGDVIRGDVVCELTKRLACDEVVAKLNGEARVYWFEDTVTQTALRQRTPYEQRQSLIQKDQTVWTMDNGQQQTATLDAILRFSSPTSIRSSNLPIASSSEFRGLEPGTHRFPFQFELPYDGLQTSFNVPEDSGIKAGIKYSIDVVARLGGMIQKTIGHIFPVVVGRDLNEEEDRLLQPRCEAQSFVSKGGKIRASLTLPKAGYTPGEPLNAVVNVQNLSNSSVKFASVNIVRVTHCIANKPSFSTCEHTYETSGSILPLHKVERGRSAEWTAALHVPALTPSAFIDDFIIIDYYAQLSIGFERASPKKASLSLKIPITIGTVPIGMECSSKRSLAAASLVEKVVPDFDASLSSPSPSFIPSAPPTYEDIMGGGGRGHSETLDVPPKYPGLSSLTGQPTTPVYRGGIPN